MSRFVLNIKEVKEDLSKSKQNLKNYEENVNLYLNRVLNADSVWKDKNTDGFIETVRKDRLNLNEHIDSLFSYLGIIDNFCKSLNSIITSNLDISSLNKIECDTEKLGRLVEYVNNIYNLVSDNYDLLKDIVIPQDFKYYKELKQIIDDFEDHKRTLSNIKKKLSNVSKKIDELLTETKSDVKSFDVKYISNSVCEHKYTISSISNYEKVSPVWKVANNVSTPSFTVNKNLKENNLTMGVNEKFALNNKVNVNLTEDSLKENKDIKQSFAQTKEEQLYASKLSALEDKKQGIENNIGVNLKEDSLIENQDIKQGVAQTKEEQLYASKLSTLEDKKQGIENNIDVSLREHSLIENKDIKQGVTQIKEEALNQNNLSFIEDKKQALENNINVNLQSISINPQINSVSANNTNVQTNLTSSNISSVDKVFAQSNIQTTNLNNFKIESINTVNSTENIIDANLNN